jgi:short-subunit dehydrogenase
MELRDQVVILTGASRGIGVHVAEALARRGARVVLSARDAAALDATAARVVALGGKATCVPGDVTRASDREALVEAAERVGPVAALVNNAGIEITVAVADQTLADVERQIATNLVAPIHLAQLVMPGMVARRSGAIVSVSSLSGKSATPYNAIYAATKHGINGFTSSLRIELEGTGVTAGVVCPGFVADAGMWADTGVKAPATLREVPPAAVALGVLRAIDGAAEVLVAPGPIRPLLALGQLLPGVEGRVMRWMGALAALEERARVTRARR